MELRGFCPPAGRAGKHLIFLCYFLYIKIKKVRINKLGRFGGGGSLPIFYIKIIMRTYLRRRRRKRTRGFFKTSKRTLPMVGYVRGLAIMDQKTVEWFSKSPAFSINDALSFT